MAVLVCFLSGCDNDKGEWEEREIPTGYKGPARVNPYLAAERFLNESGKSARSSRVWSDFDHDTSTIIMPGSFLSTKGVAMRALDWVEGGGMLVLTLEGGEAELNEFTGRSYGVEEEYPGLDYLLEEVGVERGVHEFEEVGGDGEGHLARPWHIAEIGVVSGEEEYDFEIEFQGPVSLSAEHGEEWDLDGSSRMVTTGYGNGMLMVLSHARPFRNAYIGRKDHAAFLEQVAEWYGDGEVVFLYGSGTSFFELIWQHAWQVVLSGMILLGAWLWMRVPRFGPVAKDDFTIRQPYGMGLKAAAVFLWRRNALEHLVRPMREELERDHQGPPEALYLSLAEESGLRQEDVFEALNSKNFKDPGAITRVVRNLQLLRKR
ncbi:MAG: DUF4350 domain-containing protein [Verrucomicrobiaceae bacterium]